MVNIKFKDRITCNTPTDQHSKCIKFLKKWNKPLGGCAGLAIFFVIMFVVIYTNIESPLPESTDVINNYNKLRRNNLMQLYGSNICNHIVPEPENFKHLCLVECMSLNDQLIQKKILDITNQCKQDGINLRISNTNFLDETLKSNWLELNNSKQIIKLYLDKPGIKYLDENAFSGNPFNNLDELTIIDSQIAYLPKNAFQNMRALRTFDFRNNNRNQVLNFSVEAGILAGMPLLESLQLQNCIRYPETITNMTGTDGSNFIKLVEIILDPNPYLDELHAYSFKKAPKLEKLIIKPSLTKVHKESFWGAPVKYLQIGEQLETLEDGTFRDCSEISPYFNGTIILGSNPWRCDCDLEWLQTYFLSENSLINKTYNPPKCANGGLDFATSNFCPDRSTTTTIITTTTIESSSITSSVTEESSTASTPVDEESSTTTTPVNEGSSTTTTPVNEQSSTTTTPVNEQSSTTTTPVNEGSSTTTTPVNEQSSTTTTPVNEQSSTTTTPVNEGSSTTTTPVNEQSSTITTPVNEESSTTEKSPITCTVVEQIIHNQINRQLMYETTLFVKNKPFEVSIFDLDNANDPVEIVITGNLENINLHWINTNNVHESGCLTIMSNVSIKPKLKRSNTYSMCLIYADEATVSPQACLGLHVLDKYELRAWIANKNKIIFISTIIIAFIVALLICGLVVFYCIRQHPNLIRGNKRVIIVESKTADVIVMPKAYDEPMYISPCDLAVPGYLTPSRLGYPLYEHVRYPPANAAVRRTRRLSVQSVSSYINATPVSNNTRVDFKRQSPLYDFIPHDIAPPLPPLNSPERRESSITSDEIENPYSIL